MDENHLSVNDCVKSRARGYHNGKDYFKNKEGNKKKDSKMRHTVSVHFDFLPAEIAPTFTTYHHTESSNLLNSGLFLRKVKVTALAPRSWGGGI